MREIMYGVQIQLDLDHDKMSTLNDKHRKYEQLVICRRYSSLSKSVQKKNTLMLKCIGY